METEWIDPIRALAWWMETLPSGEIVGDIATLVHLVALSVAIAAVLELDWRIMRAARRALTVHDTSAFNRGHRRILAALAALWASGAVLAWIATGGDPGAASPKLAAKAVTVALLTATALAMGRYALPTIAAHTGAPLLALGLATKLRLATLGALSGAGWATALTIGGSDSLASAPAPVIAGVVAATHTGALVLAWTLTLATHTRWQRANAATPDGREMRSPARNSLRSGTTRIGDDRTRTHRHSPTTLGCRRAHRLRHRNRGSQAGVCHQRVPTPFV